MFVFNITAVVLELELEEKNYNPLTDCVFYWISKQEVNSTVRYSLAHARLASSSFSLNSVSK